MAGKGEPTFLVIGTAVSAKYKGAFCEARVKKVAKLVKVKVNRQEKPGYLDVLDDDIIGPVKVGASVEVKPSDSSDPIRGTITKVVDQSMYTVVFDDGDENTLRRTQLCLKGEKHFVKSETLDGLPLSHPEHFSTPVVRSNKRHGSDSESGSEVESESDSDSGQDVRGTRSSRTSQRRRSYAGRLAHLLGKVLCIEIEDRKRTGMWVPMLVVLPCVDETMELKTRDHLLLKSFKDSKYFSVHRRDVKDFTRKMAMENSDKALKGAYEKALLYFDTDTLPQNWDREELLGCDSEEAESDSSDDEPCEEKDRFVAQLYKFMDDSSTPINKGPQIASRDLNLYRLFRIVQNLGGYNKVTNQVKWPIVHRKMRLPLTVNAVNQLKSSYNKYLYAFENFYRKLGSQWGQMGSMTRPSRSRQTPGRNLMSFRERDSPKSPRVKRSEDDEAKSVTDDSEARSDVSTAKSTRSGRNDAEKKKEDSETESEGTRKTRSRAGDKRKIDDEKGKSSKVEKPKAEEKRGTRSNKEPEEATAEKEEPKEDSPKKKVTKRRTMEEEEDEKDKRNRKRLIIKDEKEEEEDVESEDLEDEVREKRGRWFHRDDPFEIGFKLRVKYGRGKNQKIYEAKVIEIEEQGGTPTYLVHYAGWNNRYNEWVKKERVVAVVEESPRSSSSSGLKSGEPSSAKSTPPPQPRSQSPPARPQTPPTPSPPASTPPKVNPAAKPNQLPAAVKAKTIMTQKKRGRPFGAVKTEASSTPPRQPTPPPPPPPPKVEVPPAASPPPPVVPPPEPPARVQTPPPEQPPPAPPQQPPRPTRSSSVEASLASGLPVVRRIRKSSGVGDGSDTPRPKSDEAPGESQSSESESSESEEEESEGEEEVKRTTRSAAAQMAKGEGEERGDPAALKVSTQSMKEANRSAKAKEVAKYREVASRLKEVANKVKEGYNKVKEFSSKLKEEVTKEEQSLKEEAHIKTEVHSCEEEGEAAKKTESTDSCPEICTTKEMLKAPKATKGKRNENAKVEVKQESTDLESTDSAVKSASEVASSPEKQVKKRGPKPRAVSAVLPAPKAVEPEVTPKKRGPKPKRKVPEEDAKSQDSESSDVAKPRKKLRRKKDEPKDEETKEPAAASEASSVGEEIKEPAAELASQLVSVDVRRNSTDELLLPQLSPQRPLDERRLSLPGPPPVIPPANPPPPPLSADEAAPKVASPVVAVAQGEELPAPSCSRVLMDNTPPDTPEGSPPPQEPHPATPPAVSPSREDAQSTESEKEANMEVEKLMERAEEEGAGGESPGACDTSTISNGSGGSSGNAPGSESDEMGPTNKRKVEEEVAEKPPPKRRRRGGHKRVTAEKACKKTSKAPVSDSDENGADSIPAKAQHHEPKTSPERRNEMSAKTDSNSTHSKQRVSKYNFLDFEDAKHLKGEERITYFMQKMADLRKIYLNLKAEVAGIDRRRKRHRRKEREAAQAAAVAAAQAAVDLVASQQHVLLNQ